MSSPRLHRRLLRPDVELDSPLIDCRLVDLSTAGLGFETSVGLRLGVPYPFRLSHGQQSMGTEAVVRWCRLVRNETVDGESRPVFRAGASFVDWQVAGIELPVTTELEIEQQIDHALDTWIGNSRTPDHEADGERTIIRHTPRLAR